MTKAKPNSTFVTRRGQKPPCNLCECGDHVWAPLTRGYVTLLSPEDAWLLERWHWAANVTKPYAFGTNDSKPRYLHRLLLPDVPVVDHKNGSCVDNRRCNLRACTHAQNSANSKLPKTNKSGLKGVRLTRHGRWRSAIRFQGKKIELGTFGNADEAAAAYRSKALELKGEFARTE